MLFSVVLLALLGCASAAQIDARPQYGGGSYGGGRNRYRSYDWNELKTTEGITQVAAGTQIIAASAAFIAPRESLEWLGIVDGDRATRAFLRAYATIQFVGAATYCSGYFKDVEMASTVAISSSAVALLMALPGLEELDIEKEMVARWMVLLCAFGRLAMRDRFSGFNPAIVIFSLVGGQFLIKPRETLDMYKVKGASRKAVDLLKASGGSLLAIAGYLGIFKERNYGLIRSEALCTYLTINAASAVQYACADWNKKEFGETPKKRSRLERGRIVRGAWAAAQGVLAVMAWKSVNEKGRRVFY